LTDRGTTETSTTSVTTEIQRQLNAGASILGENDARCVIEISGGGKLHEILRNLMQRLVGHEQRAIALALRIADEKGVFLFLSDDHVYRTSYFHNAACTFI